MSIGTMNEILVVSNLHPGESYIFSVIAVNDVGNSTPSVPLEAITLEEGNIRSA